MGSIDKSNFKRLIGVWKTSGKITVGGEELDLVGTDSYEFILDKNYILHKADVKMGNERSETFEIITADSTSKAQMNYYNSKGEHGSMTSRIDYNDFMIDGDGIYFRGTINEDNTEVSGKWFLQTEDKIWAEFIELKLQK